MASHILPTPLSPPPSSDQSPRTTTRARRKRPWQSRMHTVRSQQSTHDSQEALSRETSNVTVERGASSWWRIRLGRGMINDVKRRAPYYLSDWSDAWDYRVVPATVYIYFTKYAFSIQSFHDEVHGRAHSLGCRSSRTNSHRACDNQLGNSLIIGAAFCLLWPFRWTCSQRPT